MADEARAYVTLTDLLHLRHRAKGFSFLPKQPIHSLLAGRHASRLRGRGLEFEELRRYYEGDDVRAIDWPATARLGVPYVRVFTEERDRPVLLVVDQRLGMFFGSRLTTKSVQAADATALAAWRVSSLGDRIGAIVFSENGVDTVRPRSREGAVTEILHAVVRQNNALKAADPRPGDPRLLNAALDMARRVVPHDGLVVLISDVAGANADTVRLVTELTAHNDVMSVFVFDPLEAELPDIGRATLSNGAEQIEADLSAGSLRRAYAASFAERRTAIETFSRRRAIPILPVSTYRTVEEQFRELLGRRLEHRQTRSNGAAA